jgi:leucyl-tRNA synthetase
MTLSIPHSDTPSPGSAAYDPAAIERKWQARWQEEGTNAPDLEHGPRPFYQLMMFPYPSAEGLHIGNLYAFTGNDIHGRFRRLQGHTVFEPIGFDAFGIHSENYALKLGVHPMELIPRNIANFRRQLRRAGLMVDWTHELSTTDPHYYRWTQWVFLELYKKGLAYKKRAAVNWCPSCKTVLANEQVIAGACERCGTPVEQRFLDQWFFRITDYAGRLLTNLDRIDWSETTRSAQRNWIGRSEGAEIVFEAQGPGNAGPLDIRAFTTRPDTIFGATYLVLAPEHPAVELLAADGHRAAVDAYRERTARQDLVSRKVVTDRKKTGVFTGAYATNPATREPIPVWIADYVLMEYGTGAIMAVPGHDERDFDFARTFDLPIRRVVAALDEQAGTPLTAAYTDDADGRLVNSGPFDGTPVADARRALTHWLAEQGVATPVTNYRLHDWCISRQRYWGPPIPILYCDTCGTVPVPEADLPVELPPIPDFRPDDTGVSPLARHEEWYRVPCPTCGAIARRETDVSDTFLDSAWYFLRYPSTGRDDVPFDPALTRRWLPVDSYIGGNEHAVLHLLYARFFYMFMVDAGYVTGDDEPFTRLFNQGMVLYNGEKMSKSHGNVVGIDETVDKHGVDAMRLFLLKAAPPEDTMDWTEDGIVGRVRFVQRIWRAAEPLASSARAVPLDRLPELRGDMQRELVRALHVALDSGKNETETYRFHYNVTTAKLDELINVLSTALREPGGAGDPAVLYVVHALPIVLAPFAPHLADELWSRMGYERSVHLERWIDSDPAALAVEEITLVVQVNGKVRARIQTVPGIAEDDAFALAMREPTVTAQIDGKQVRKRIFVPDKLLNIVAA